MFLEKTYPPAPLFRHIYLERAALCRKMEKAGGRSWVNTMLIHNEPWTGISRIPQCGIVLMNKKVQSQKEKKKRKKKTRTIEHRFPWTQYHTTSNHR